MTLHTILYTLSGLPLRKFFFFFELHFELPENAFFSFSPVCLASCVSKSSYTFSQQRRSRLDAPHLHALQQTTVYFFDFMFSYHITWNYPMLSLMYIRRESPVCKQDDVNRCSPNGTTFQPFLDPLQPMWAPQRFSLSVLRIGSF